MKKFIANPKKVPGSLLIGGGRMVNKKPVSLDENDPQVAGAIAKGLLIPYKKGKAVKASKPAAQTVDEPNETSTSELSTALPDNLKTEKDTEPVADEKPEADSEPVVDEKPEADSEPVVDEKPTAKVEPKKAKTQRGRKTGKK